MRQSAGACKQFLRRDDLICSSLHLLCAYIAVTEGLAQRLPIWSQANVVNRPAIDGNGAILRRCLRSFAQTFF